MSGADAPAPESPPEVSLPTLTILKALHGDARNASEKDIAATLVRVWEEILPLINRLANEGEIGHALLEASFPDWRARGLVQIVASITASMHKGAGVEELHGYASRPRSVVWTQSSPGGLAHED